MHVNLHSNKLTIAPKAAEGKRKSLSPDPLLVRIGLQCRICYLSS